MQIGSFISTEEESGGGNVIPSDTMMKDGMEGAMGHFRVMESLDLENFVPSPVDFESTFTS
jgi:hypothetical protein